MKKNIITIILLAVALNFIIFIITSHNTCPTEPGTISIPECVFEHQGGWPLEYSIGMNNQAGSRYWIKILIDIIFWAATLYAVKNFLLNRKHV